MAEYIDSVGRQRCGMMTVSQVACVVWLGIRRATQPQPRFEYTEIDSDGLTIYAGAKLGAGTVALAISFKSIYVAGKSAFGPLQFFELSLLVRWRGATLKVGVRLPSAPNGAVEKLA